MMCAEDSVRLLVLSQYFSPATLQRLVARALPAPVDATAVQRWIDVAQGEIAQARARHPGACQCAQLDDAAQALRQQGVLLLHWCDWTVSSGHGLAAELADEAGCWGYAFFDEQDLMACLETSTLYLAHDTVETFAGEGPSPVQLGELVHHELRRAGLSAHWNGNICERILIDPLVWLRDHSPDVEQQVLEVFERRGLMVARA